MIFSLALLLPLSFAALISEYAGVLAVFLEGLVNLSSFLFFFFSIAFGNLYVALCFHSRHLREHLYLLDAFAGGVVYGLLLALHSLNVFL